MRTVLLGVDIGTSSAKAVVLSANGTVLSTADQAYPISSPRPGWAEQDPEVWVAAAVATAREALTKAGASRSSVAGLSFTGQMHGTVCLDLQGRPTRPAIIWADQRSHGQVRELRVHLGDKRLAAWTRNPVATGFMLPTWLWLREREPETARSTRWLLLPKDYVRYRMTGVVATEPSDASSTSLFDPASQRWSKPLLRALDIDAGILPCILPSTVVTGELRSAFAERMGIAEGTPVVAGGSDQAAQALGNGVVAPGVVCSTIGTGGQLLAPTARSLVDPKLRLHSFCHVLPDLWHVETAILSAGLSLRWLRDSLFPGQSYQALADVASRVDTGADDLYFLPYLAGERTPYMDPRARGAFVGLTRRHGPAHIIRALMEGVVYAMRQGLDLIDALGVPTETVVASGGAARHPLWLHLQADVYGRPVRQASGQAAAPLGAAMLAGLGVGVFSDAEEAIARSVRWCDDVVDPDTTASAVHQRRVQAFRELYPSLADAMHGLAAQT